MDGSEYKQLGFDIQVRTKGMVSRAERMSMYSGGYMWVWMSTIWGWTAILECFFLLGWKL